MCRSVFSKKLDTLPSTLALFCNFDADDLADALSKGGGRHVLAVGSGGSAVVAEYLARCRDTLGLGPTSVQSPMQLVLETQDLSESDVWLFSAGSQNPDIVASVRAAVARGAANIHLVTRNPDGQAAWQLSTQGGRIHVVPVSEWKDGFLATHSLLSSVTALLLAADLVACGPHGSSQLLASLSAQLESRRDTFIEGASWNHLTTLRPTDTLLIVADPLLRPVSVLLEISVWEASLCPVQVTDLRNFAHGRHSWLHHRGLDTFVLALTTAESRPIWSAISNVVPSSIRRFAQEHGAGGRLDIALAIISTLGLVERIGETLGIDPGSPGFAEYGRLIYNDQSLVQFAAPMLPNVRHKRAAIARADNFDPTCRSLDAISSEWISDLANAVIAGVVLDYDGTIVATNERYSLPNKMITFELIRLLRLGLRLGIATGRGGSAGETIRSMFPADMLNSISIGYYNGGHVRSAEVNIETDPAMSDPNILDTEVWLDANPGLFLKKAFKNQAVQITINKDKLRRPYRFLSDLGKCAAYSDGRVKVLESGHSFDIIPMASSKLAIVDAVISSLSENSVVLRVGDSGSKTGNDHELLTHAHGISVGDVCGAAEGCWSLFGSDLQGPDALLRILRSLLPVEYGKFCLDLPTLYDCGLSD